LFKRALFSKKDLASDYFKKIIMNYCP